MKTLILAVSLIMSSTSIFAADFHCKSIYQARIEKLYKRMDKLGNPTLFYGSSGGLVIASGLGSTSIAVLSTAGLIVAAAPLTYFGVLFNTTQKITNNEQTVDAIEEALDGRSAKASVKTGLDEVVSRLKGKLTREEVIEIIVREEGSDFLCPEGKTLSPKKLVKKLLKY